jgi:hypothetical protein
MRLQTIVANLSVLLMAVGASGAFYLLRALGPECG